MRNFAERILKFLKSEDGPTAVEYAIILALNVVLCVVAITGMGANANKVFFQRQQQPVNRELTRQPSTVGHTVWQTFISPDANFTGREFFEGLGFYERT